VTSTAESGGVVDQQRAAIIVYLMAGGAIGLERGVGVESMVVQIAMRRVAFGTSLVG
jgi:hypothetical protein